MIWKNNGAWHNKQHAKNNEVIKGLNPKIYKSKNQFLIEACEFYIDHYGQFYHEPNASLVIYSGAERGSEESTCGRCSESNNSYLLLSGGADGKNEFISKEAALEQLVPDTINLQ